MGAASAERGSFVGHGTRRQAERVLVKVGEDAGLRDHKEMSDKDLQLVAKDTHAVLRQPRIGCYLGTRAGGLVRYSENSTI